MGFCISPLNYITWQWIEDYQPGATFQNILGSFGCAYFLCHPVHRHLGKLNLWVSHMSISWLGVLRIWGGFELHLGARVGKGLWWGDTPCSHLSSTVMPPYLKLLGFSALLQIILADSAPLLGLAWQSLWLLLYHPHSWCSYLRNFITTHWSLSF